MGTLTRPHVPDFGRLEVHDGWWTYLNSEARLALTRSNGGAVLARGGYCARWGGSGGGLVGGSSGGGGGGTS